MQLNENMPLIFTEKPEKEAVFVSNMPDEIISSMQLNSAPIVLSFISNVDIPLGFRWNEIEPITWEVSIDQHLLHIVTTLLRQQSSTELALYFVRLLGSLYYNRVVKGFRAVSGQVNVVTGAAGPGNKTSVLAGSAGTVAFNTFGEVPINESLGYSNSIEEVVVDCSDLINIEVVDEFPSIILPDGTVITYDPANPSLFFSYFDGEGIYTFVVRSNVIIRTSVGPTS
ncbi:MAG: hypothetical protein Q4F05_18255 [bacterium]|nr:hypothetical protein [bacterium]